MRKFFIGGLAALACSAAMAKHPAQVAPEVEAVYKARVADRMLDPGAVQFRNVRFFSAKPDGANPFMCAEFNAKNSYGGYVGFQPVAVLGDADKTLISVPDFAAVLCK